MPTPNSKELTKALKSLDQGKLTRTHASELALISRDTGSPEINALLGGGLPQGVTVFGGNPGSGKTTSALKACAAAQARGETVVWINVDGKFHAGYAESLGVHLEDLIVFSTQTVESSFQVVEKLGGLVDLIIYDCLGAGASHVELDHDSGADYSDFVVEVAIERALRRVIPRLGKSTLLIISQMRDKAHALYGRTDFIFGGTALKHAAWSILEFRVLIIFNQSRKAGVKVQIKNLKDQLAGLFPKQEIEILHSPAIAATTMTPSLQVVA